MAGNGFPMSLVGRMFVAHKGLMQHGVLEGRGQRVCGTQRGSFFKLFREGEVSVAHKGFL